MRVAAISLKRIERGHRKFFNQHAAHRALHRTIHLRRFAETHLHFCRMHIHVHRIRRQLHIQHKQRKSSDHQQGVIRFRHRVRNRTVFDPTPVHKQILQATIAAMNRGGSDVPIHFHARVIVCAQFVRFRCNRNHFARGFAPKHFAQHIAQFAAARRLKNQFAIGDQRKTHLRIRQRVRVYKFRNVRVFRARRFQKFQTRRHVVK